MTSGLKGHPSFQQAIRDAATVYQLKVIFALGEVHGGRRGIQVCDGDGSGCFADQNAGHRVAGLVHEANDQVASIAPLDLHTAREAGHVHQGTGSILPCQDTAKLCALLNREVVLASPQCLIPLRLLS